MHFMANTHRNEIYFAMKAAARTPKKPPKSNNNYLNMLASNEIAFE